MNLLNGFFLQQEKLKIQKRLGQDRIMDSLKLCFQIGNFKKFKKAGGR